MQIKFSNMTFNGKRKASETDEVSGDDTVRINFSIRAQVCITLFRNFYFP